MPFLTAWPLATVLEVSEKTIIAAGIVCSATKSATKTSGTKNLAVHEVQRLYHGRWSLVYGTV